MSLKRRHLHLQITASFILVFVLMCVFMNICISVSALTITPSTNQIYTKLPVYRATPIPVDNTKTEPELVQIKMETYVAGFDTELLELVKKPLAPMIESMSLETVEEDPLANFSEQDIMLLERVTMSEASTQSFEAQVAVAQTIINRLHSGGFGSTIDEIVHAPNQYCTANNGDPSQQVMDAVIEAIRNPSHPSDMFYFRENHYHKWAEDYEKIGVFYFSTEP